MMNDRTLTVLALVFALCGCGGDSGGSGAVPFVPGGSTGTNPAPSPSPTTPLTGEIKPSADTVVSAGSIEFVRTETSTSAWTYNPDSVLRVSFDAAARSYTLTNNARTQSFGPSEFQGEESAPASPMPSVTWQARSSEQLDFLLIAKSPNIQPPVNLRYGAYGAWQHNDAMAGASRVRLDYFTYGSPTPSAGMPRTGTIKFAVPITGNFVRADGLFLTGNSNFIDVNFGAGTVSGVISLTGRDFLNPIIGGIGAFLIEGRIVGNAVSGELSTSPAPSIKGRYRLLFYGPNAEELALVATGGNDRSAFTTAGVGVRF